MSENIYVTKPTLAPLAEVTKLLEGVWQSGVMTHNGPLVQRFEKECAEALGVPTVVTCVNGTMALQLAIRALGLRGEIITTPFTFIATINSILWENCTPVFVDIDPETFNIDPNLIEEKITCHTVGIMPVHVFGNVCDIDGIQEIAERHNLKVIYDACHAVGVNYKGRSVFEYGDISATSFHATKMLNTAEGGGCFTLDAKLDERLREMRFFGFENHADVVCDGTNAKMTEVHAAVGLANLPLLQPALEDRKKKYMLYKELLSADSRLSFQRIDYGCNYSYFPVVFENEEMLLRVEAKLKENHIYPRRYFYPSVNTFRRLVPYVEMPKSEDLASRILCLPLYYDLPESDIRRIAELVLAAV